MQTSYSNVQFYFDQAWRAAGTCGQRSRGNLFSIYTSLKNLIIRCSLPVSCQYVFALFVLNSMGTSDFLKGCPSNNSLVRNKIVTKLTAQGFINIVISWLCLSCWNNLVKSLIFPSSLLQVVNSKQFVPNLSQQRGTSSARTTSEQLVNRHVNRLATICLQVCYKLRVCRRVITGNTCLILVRAA